MTNEPEVLSEEAVQSALSQLPGWRYDEGYLLAAYAAPSAGAALALIAAIGDAAEEANHHPDVDWRYDRVFVGTTTHQAGGKPTARDVQLAIRVADLADAVGAHAEPDGSRRGA